MHRFMYQAIAVLLVIGCVTYLADELGFQSGLNVLWMFGLPVVVAIIANQDAASRCLAGMALIVVSLVSTMGTAAIFGLGP